MTSWRLAAVAISTWASSMNGQVVAIVRILHQGWWAVVVFFDTAFPLGLVVGVT